MQGKNRYFRRSCLSEEKFRMIICSFALDFPASKIAELSDVSRPTINKLLLKLRIRVAQVWTLHRPSLARLKSMNPVLVRAVSVGRRVVEQAVKQLSSGS